MGKRVAKWIQKSGVPEHKGALHRQLGIPQGKRIPHATLRKAAHKRGKLGQRARFALLARGFKHPHPRKARHAHSR